MSSTKEQEIIEETLKLQQPMQKGYDWEEYIAMMSRILPPIPEPPQTNQPIQLKIYPTQSKPPLEMLDLPSA
jgi:hypothetical protein